MSCWGRNRAYALTHVLQLMLFIQSILRQAMSRLSLSSMEQIFANLEGSVKSSLYLAFRFHLGTLAFGSFVIAVVQFIRYLLLLAILRDEREKPFRTAVGLCGDRGCSFSLESQVIY